ncbi:MAG: gliding motility-associated C-terminal domain-containing protein [Sphingobacteriales bacterium]|nr:MAG: gliding motility-associated C-terminal domain-containing protein [Sphingobacteriales bacterium]
MKKCITLAFAYVLALVFSGSTYAQNLVANPGFEQYNICPSAIGMLNGNVTGWVSPTSFGTPDLFNGCTISAECGMPNNIFGYQRAHGGKGMAGIITWEAEYDNGVFTDHFSEYLQTELQQPLQAGKNYCVTFFVSNAMTNGVFSANKTYLAVDEVGVHFSANKVQSNTARTLSLPYHIMNTSGRFITDSAGWTKISTLYTATGTEKFMTIGVFTNANNPPNFIKMDPAATGYKYHSYLYLDDVSVEQINPADTIKASFDTTYCNPGILPISLKSKRADGIYSWNTGASTEAINVSSDSTYLCYTYTNCRWYVDTFRVKYDPQGYLDLPREAINCSNSPVTLKAGKKFKSYQWNTGATIDSITVETPGKYIVTVSGDCGVQSDTVDVFIQPPTPSPEVRDTMICAGTENVVLNVKGSNVNWYTSKNGSGGYVHQLPVNSNLLGTRTYFISQTIGKCESERVPLSIYVKYKPKDELSPQSVMCERYRDTIGVQLPDVSYRWNTGYNSCCIIPNREGKFAVNVSNECGSYTDTVNVVFSMCDTCVKMPNAFTPNMDGKNDEFKPLTICPITNFHMIIYNRWGNKIFETNDLSIGWNGRTEKDLVADNGAYVYVLEYKAGATGQTKRHSGHVLLIR